MHFYNKVHHVLLIIFKGLFISLARVARTPVARGQRARRKSLARGLHSVVYTQYACTSASTETFLTKTKSV